MRILRGIGGGLLWIVASLLGLVALLLCVTVILLPVGIPLLLLARRLFGAAVKLMTPREVRHPVEEAGKALRKKGRRGKHPVEGVGKTLKKKGRRAQEHLPGSSRRGVVPRAKRRLRRIA